MLTRLAGSGGLFRRSFLTLNEPGARQLDEQRQAAERLPRKPLISVILPVYNPPAEILSQTIQAVIDQTYLYWEICLVDGHSDRAGLKELLEHWAARDARIRIKILPKNLGISGNSNEALRMATGEFVALLDHDDLLAPFALFEVAKFLNENPDFDMVYSDEDRIDPRGRRHTPFFKPDWSPDLLQCFMYVGHLTVYRRDLVQAVGGFRPEFDFSQDYDLALRVTEKTNRIGHIPKILYHWRTLPGSGAAGDKPFARATNLAALASAIERRNYFAEVLEYPTANRVRFKLHAHPLVSIIIPTDNEENIFSCLGTLLRITSYPAFEIVVVTNTALASRICKAYLHDLRIGTVPFDAPFNFSAKCNKGAAKAKGEYLLFLNDDVQCLEESWIDILLGYFQQEGVGAVSPKMIYSNGLIQHAGLVTGVRGFVGTAFHVEPRDSTAYFNLVQSTRTVSALSAACMLLRKDIFDTVGGFDEINTPIMHSDVDLCFKIRARGLRLVYTPFTTLKHVGHVSLGEFEEQHGNSHSNKADLYLLKRWGEHLSYDPYYTDNMRRLLYRDSPEPYWMYAGNNINAPRSNGDILFVTHDLSMSGAPIIVETLARRFLSQGFFVAIAAPSSGPLLEQCRLDRLPTIIDEVLFNSPANLNKLLNQFDVIVANTILSWGVVHAAKSLGKPVIWFVHEGDFGRKLAQRNRDVRRAFAMADFVVFPSRQTELKYRKFAARQNFKVIHYGIEKTEFPGRAPLARSERIRVVLVGSVEPRKGQDLLVRCMRGLGPDLVDSFEFYFVGRVLETVYYDLLKKKTEALKNVYWIGEVSHRASLEYISNSDVVVCASRDETGPIAVIEGMSLGKTIVSTRVGIVPEIIEHGETGLLIEIDDNKALSECLLRLCKDRSLLQKLGNAARKSFEDHLALERYSRDVACLVNGVTKPAAPEAQQVVRSASP